MTIDEQLRVRAKAVIEDVSKALQGLDSVSEGYKSVGAKVSEEAKRRVLVGRVKDQLVMAYNMGVVNTEARIYGAPWEHSLTPIVAENMDVMSGDGWEIVSTYGEHNSRLIWRRRKVAEVVNEIEMCGRCEHEIDLHGLFSGCKVLGCQCPQFHRGEVDQ